MTLIARHNFVGLASWGFNRIRRLFSRRSIPACTRDDLISTYREWDCYTPDIIVHEAVSIHVPQSLPSEPPDGVTYDFCASGYMTQGKDQGTCTIHTEWRNVDNYCHWTFCELPLVCLALESKATTIVLADRLLKVKERYQQRWWEIIRKKYPDKRIVRLSSLPNNNGMIPVNHDTSSSNRLIGKCAYKYYHHSKPTPYAIGLLTDFVTYFDGNDAVSFDKIYINRKIRRLDNEVEVQDYLSANGYHILNLEDYKLDEQIQIFANAKFVIGFHGAGLANLVFSHNGAKVIEIVDPDCVYPSYADGLVIPGQKAPRTYYHVLSHMKCLNYRCIQSANYHLDMEKLQIAIEDLERLSS